MKRDCLGNFYNCIIDNIQYIYLAVQVVRGYANLTVT